MNNMNTDGDNNIHNIDNTIGNTINHTNKTGSDDNDTNSSSIISITILFDIIINISISMVAISCIISVQSWG